MRVDDATRDRWKQEADGRGYLSLSAFVRACVETVLAHPRESRDEAGPARPAARRLTPTVPVDVGLERTISEAALAAARPARLRSEDDLARRDVTPLFKPEKRSR